MDETDDQRKYSWLQAPIAAFYRADFYDDVVQRWTGVGFWYLIVLLAICCGANMAVFYAAIHSYLQGEGGELMKQIPPIVINDGQVQVDAEQPYFITQPDSDEPIAVIDTTGQYTSLRQLPNTFILLTQGELIYRTNPQRSETLDLSQVESFEIDADSAQARITTALPVFTTITFAVLLVVSTVWRFGLALVLGGIGVLIARRYGKDLAYYDLLRLSVIALTPVILVETVLWIIGFAGLCAWWLLSLIIAVAYVWYGVRCVGEIHSGTDPDQPWSPYQPPM